MISLSEIGDFRLYGDDDLPASAFVPECPTVRGRSLVQCDDGFDECSKMSGVKLLSDFNQLLLIRLHEAFPIKASDDSGSGLNAQQLGTGVADLNPVRRTLPHSSSRTGRIRLFLPATTRLCALRL
jgi:hypothetical protein